MSAVGDFILMAVFLSYLKNNDAENSSFVPEFMIIAQE